MKYLKKLLFVIFVMFITGCDIGNDNMKNINIYTTTYPIKFLITSLYGDNSNVYSIYPNGVDLSEYKISDRKIKEYANSDLFVFNSLDNDMSYAVKMINYNSGLKVIDVSTGIKYNYSVEELWLNPNNYLSFAENLKNGLSEYINNPYLVSEIENKYNELSYEISKLDASLTECLENGYYDTIVSDSDSFNFLESRGIKVISLEENDNLSNNKIDEVKKLIAENKIKYIYSTSKEANSIAKSLIDEYKLELVSINGMHSTDGDINNSNDNYFTIMQNNIKLIEKELYKD